MPRATASQAAADSPVEVVDPPQAAKAAGLRYVTDAMPGIGRRKTGPGFTFVDPRGRTIRNGDELRRIRALAVPPAWTDVWICPDPRGHIQATGRDARGRKQYRYHPRWREVRDETKYNRLAAFGDALSGLRQRIERDLASPDLNRDKVVATIVRLLDKTLIRVGNDEYARDNKSFGLTTLRDKHVSVDGATITFEFRGKSGKLHEIDINDARAATIVRACRDLPGYELFQYLDENRERRTVDSNDVNEYLRAATGEAFTAKDFRTWGGTVLAARALVEIGPASSKTETKRNITRAVEAVAALLGNTATIARKSYIHPTIIETYERGELADLWTSTRARKTRWLRPDEAIVLSLLKRVARAEAEREKVQRPRRRRTAA